MKEAEYLNKSGMELRNELSEEAMKRLFIGQGGKKGKKFIKYKDWNKNIKYLKEYYSYCKVNGNKISTIESKIKILNYLFEFLKKDAKLINRKDIEKFLASKSTLRSKTLTLWKIHIKAFYNWLFQLPERNYPENVNWIKIKIDKKEFVKDILTRDEIKNLLNGCGNIRDKCIISILYDSGIRVGELLNIKLKDIESDEYGFKIMVSGKTGERKVRLVDSVPILKQWLNEHPYKDDGEKSLFISLHRLYGKVLTTPTIYSIIHKAMKSNNIKKRIYPHLFRHSKLTHLAQEGFNEMELRVYAGWARSSSMPDVYLHIREDDLDNKIRRKNGMMLEDEEKKILQEKLKLKPKECPMCNEVNDVNNMFCFKCGQILDIKAIKDIDDVNKSVTKVMGEDNKFKEQIITDLKKQILKELRGQYVKNQ